MLSKYSHLIIIAFLIIFLTLSYCKPSKRSSKRASFGSACNNTLKCDIHSLLACEDNTCQCLYPDAMEYNVDLGTCVSLVNEVCGYLERKRVFINCVPNSSCDQQQGVCKCIQHGFTESGSGHCVKQKGFGEACHSDSECMTDLSLSCFEEICQCEPDRHVPHNPDLSPSGRSKTKCVSLAGQPCTAKTGCVPKASCVILTENGGQDVILSSVHGWMHPGMCKCDLDYEMDTSGYCHGMYGTRCDVLENVTCSNNFQCINGFCSCAYPDDQVYHEESRSCLSHLGGPCSVPRENQEGQGHASRVNCDAFLECKNSVCGCRDGFVENKERGCDLTYGQLCTGHTMSKCDEAAGLYCVNGRCACKDELRQFDKATGKCLGRLGSSCEIVGEFRRKVSCSNCRRGSENMLDTSVEPVCQGNATCQVARAQLFGLTSRGVCVSAASLASTNVTLDSPDVISER